MKKLIDIHSYFNTTSSAGLPEKRTIDALEIVRINCWFNFYGNPSYVFHMNNGDIHFLVDDYGAMNGISHLSRVLVKRKKDLFNRFA